MKTYQGCDFSVTPVFATAKTAYFSLCLPGECAAVCSAELLKPANQDVLPSLPEWIASCIQVLKLLAAVLRQAGGSQQPWHPRRTHLKPTSTAHWERRRGAMCLKETLCTTFALHEGRIAILA